MQIFNLINNVRRLLLYSSNVNNLAEIQCCYNSAASVCLDSHSALLEILSEPKVFVLMCQKETKHDHLLLVIRTWSDAKTAHFSSHPKCPHILPELPTVQWPKLAPTYLCLPQLLKFSKVQWP